VALIADSGGIYALYDASDRHHTATRAVLRKERGPVIVPMAVLSELDYLLREFLSIDAELDFLEAVASGAFTLEPLPPVDVARCRELITTYRSLDLGLADSAVMATAERLGVDRILTVDERHFRAVRSKGGKPFVILPADAAR